jgi:hypothetical protein
VFQRHTQLVNALASNLCEERENFSDELIFHCRDFESILSNRNWFAFLVHVSSLAHQQINRSRKMADSPFE